MAVRRASECASTAGMLSSTGEAKLAAEEDKEEDEKLAPTPLL